ncbi:MAG TPA: bacteriohemerythrin [Acetobacteraceae bacterium]|nr:bacteriohemerythrin [Acetobacteraceae bacterium]
MSVPSDLLPELSLPADIARLAALLVQSDLAALAFTRGDVLLYANDAFRRLFSISDSPPGTTFDALIMPADRDRIAGLLRGTGDAPTSCVVAAPRKDGGTIDIELRALRLTPADEELRAVVAQDVTDRSRAAARLNLLAFSDPLTGLANRALFSDRLRQAVLAAARDGAGFAVLMLDLDGFKSVNDRLGHAAGDVVLQHVGRRIQASLRPTEIVARLGGDEFAILLDGVRRAADADAVADRLLQAIRQPILAGGHAATVSTTIGMALFPDHGRTVEHLLVTADSALYRAKRGGGGCRAWAGEETAAGIIPQLIVWSTANEVGVRQMDAQHAHLFDLLNVLAEALQNGREPKPPFREFIGAVARHFADEERLMVEAGYPSAARHREEHQRLLAEVAGLVLDGQDVSASLVLRYLQDWLCRHIDGFDRDFAGYFKHARRAAEADRPT